MDFFYENVIFLENHAAVVLNVHENGPSPCVAVHARARIIGTGTSGPRRTNILSL